MKKIFLSLLALCTALPFAGSAQKIITFESKPIKNEKSKKESYGNNSITLGLGSFLNGYTSLYYERTATRFMSVAVGAGFTYRSYMNDFGAIVWSDGKNSNLPGAYDIEDDYSSYKYRKSTPGFYASIAPHFYFNDAPLDGFYLAPMVEMKQYKYEARLADVTVPVDNYGYSYKDADVPRSTGSMSEHMNCIDLTFNTGGHYELHNHLSVGWNIGLGLRHLNAERLDIAVADNGTGGFSYVNSVHSYTATRPLVQFNFVMGGWF
jgi:hypothetical protein